MNKITRLTCVPFNIRYLRTRPTSSPSASKFAEELVASSISDKGDKRCGARRLAIRDLDLSISSHPNDDVKELEGAPIVKSKPLGRQLAEQVRSTKKFSSLKMSGSSQLKDVCNLDEVQLAKLLRKQVIYADENLIIFNKPHGLSAHDSNHGVSIRSSLPILSKMIFGLNTSTPLMLCGRLDKNTTGITVCATNRDMAHQVRTLFRQQTIRKKYWGISVGTPEPREGVIDIPLAMCQVDGGRNGGHHCRMGLAPEQKLDFQTGQMTSVRQRRADIAITHYRTLDTNDGLSLIEFQPFSTVKHQIRVHAAEALMCPLLGDHKYSNPGRLLPQRLPKTILSMLNIRSARSRDLPMHLHLREVIIPGVLESTSNPNLLISAKVSESMFKMMKLFKLKPGPQTDFKYPARLEALWTSSSRNNPLMEELYKDPFEESSKEEASNVQRADCYTVYKPKVKVKFHKDQSA